MRKLNLKCLWCHKCYAKATTLPENPSEEDLREFNQCKRFCDVKCCDEWLNDKFYEWLDDMLVIKPEFASHEAVQTFVKQYFEGKNG